MNFVKKMVQMKLTHLFTCISLFFVFSIKYVGVFTAALIMIQVAKDYWNLLGDVTKSDVSLQLELFY